MKVYLHTRGGLGNILFQILFGESLQASTTTAVTVYYVEPHNRENRPGLSEYQQFLCAFIGKDRIVKESAVRTTTPTIEESQMGYSEALVQELTKRIDEGKCEQIQIRGYFQSYRYWNASALQRLQNAWWQFQNLKPLGDLATTNTTNTATTHNIMIHVRRTDYLHFQTVYYQPDEDYYQLSILALVQQLKKANDASNFQLQIFSDDLDYVQQNWHWLRAFPHQFQTETDSEKALALMSQCDSFVTCNSTFSLMAYHLRKKTTTAAVAAVSKPLYRPKQWFLPSCALKLPESDIVPPPLFFHSKETTATIKIKIPQQVFTCSKEPLEPDMVTMLQMRLGSDWQYRVYLDADIENFFRENPLPQQFPDVLQKFKNLKRGQHKADLFRYYYLYVKGGVYLDSDAMLEIPLEQLLGVELDRYHFLSVRTNKDTFFNGFIVSTPQHPLIGAALQHLYHLDPELLQSDYFLVCRYLATAFDQYMGGGSSVDDKQRGRGVKLLQEKQLGAPGVVASVTTLDDSTSPLVILNHHWQSKIVPLDDVATQLIIEQREFLKSDYYKKKFLERRIPVFVINVKSATARRERMERRLQHYGIVEACTFIEASTPESVQRDQIQCVYKDVLKTACAHSHYKLWQQQVKEQTPQVLILEDDVIFHRDWLQRLHQGLLSMESMDALFLNSLSNITSQYQPHCWTQGIKRECLTGAYLLSLEAATYLVNHYEKAIDVADNMTQHLQERGRCHRYFPWLALQENLDSSLQSLDHIQNLDRAIKQMLGEHLEAYNEEREISKVEDRRRIVNNIKSASYGKDSVNVSVVTAQCQRLLLEQGSLRICNDNFGDPCFGHRKSLRMEMRDGSDFTFEEGKLVNLRSLIVADTTTIVTMGDGATKAVSSKLNIDDMDNTLIEGIDKIFYGREGLKNVEVTAQVKQLLLDQHGLITISSNDYSIFRDSCFGYKKTLQIRMKGGYDYIAQENAVFELASLSPPTASSLQKKSEKPMKLLHLVLYSFSEHYDQMKCASEVYYKQCEAKGIHTLYYTFDPNLPGEIGTMVLQGNLLTIKGSESVGTFVPGVLDKTVAAFRYVEKFLDLSAYSFVIRSNISSVVNFSALVEQLRICEYNDTFSFGGYHIENLQWTLGVSGIHDHRHRGTLYPQGTCLIFNKDAFGWLLKNLNLLDRTIVDDVSIGLLFKHHWTKNVVPRRIGSGNYGNDFAYFQNSKAAFKTQVVFRNKSSDRAADVRNMKTVCQDLLLLEKEKDNSKSILVVEDINAENKQQQQQQPIEIAQVDFGTEQDRRRISENIEYAYYGRDGVGSVLVTTFCQRLLLEKGFLRVCNENFGDTGFGHVKYLHVKMKLGYDCVVKEGEFLTCKTLEQPENFETLQKTPCRILHLVLYSFSEHYDKMKVITAPFYKQFEALGIRTIYYTFDPSIEADYELDGDLLRIRGHESGIVPGVLDKTLLAFQYFANAYYSEYSYIIRSNISTVINFHELQPRLKVCSYNDTFSFGGLLLLKLSQIDILSGVSNSQYFGTIFPQGSSLIFNKKAFSWFLQNIPNLDRSIVDDVSITLLLKKYDNIIPMEFGIRNQIHQNNCGVVIDNKINANNYQPTPLAFRNKRSDRQDDIKSIFGICKDLTIQSSPLSAVLVATNDNKSVIQQEIVEAEDEEFIGKKKQHNYNYNLVSLCYTTASHEYMLVEHRKCMLDVVGVEKVICCGPGDLSENFKMACSIENLTSQRGAGYWMWKPFVILKALEEEASQFVLYCDVSTAPVINKIELLEEIGNSDILLGRLCNDESYCKKECIEYFCVDINSNLLKTEQITATMILFRNNANTHKFVKEWLRLVTLDSGRLVCDPTIEERSRQHKNFIDHRHDQSILSLLLKTNNHNNNNNGSRYRYKTLPFNKFYNHHIFTK